MYNPMSFDELLKKQSVPVGGQEHVRANPMMKDGQVLEYLEEDNRTLHTNFLKGLERSEGGPCLGWRPAPGEPYSWITYQEVLDRTQALGSGLIKEGAKTCPEQFIGIFSQNRVEWKITEQACNSFSMAIVPLYDTLGPESIEHIVTLCELKIIVVDNNTKSETLLKGISDNRYTLDLIVSMEKPSESVAASAAEAGVKLMTFEGVEAAGKEDLQEFVPPKPEDLHTICFTSGTTGLPKGAMLTHGNLIANLAGVYAMGENSFLKMDKNDVHISYLPLAHVFERLIAAMIYQVGGSVGFFQGNIKLLTNDAQALSPTVFPMVPRLINKLYDKIHASVSGSFLKSFMLERAKSSKLGKLKNGVVTRSSFWDKLVFKGAQALIGGRARVMVTGAAPCSKEVLNFARVAFGVNFTEGYGQTEATAGISISVPGDFFSGSVGAPALCNMIKLVDVPEKDYYAKDGKGEICAKGANVFIGYYKNEEKTKEALDEDGWLHTGDVGQLLPNGSLKIIDRKKNIFKLSQGEYIAPEKIEGVMVQSAAVAQVFIHGISLKSTLVGIVIPDVDTLKDWCATQGVEGEYEDLCKKEEVQKLIFDDVIAIGKKRGLKSFELPKKIRLSSELFSVENELMTPTFKSRRPQIAKRYNAEIEEMYSDLD